MELITGFQILGGLILLAFGGDGLVRGSVDIARRFRMPEFVIGLTLVGFGTSMPELTTSVGAALSGSSGVALGNVVGSNIGNILLILALAALVRPIDADPKAVSRDGMAMIVATLAVIAFCQFGQIERWMGVVLILGLFGYLTYTLLQEASGTANRSQQMHADEAALIGPAPRPIWMVSGLTLLSLAGLVFGAGLLVDGSIKLAKGLGVSDTIIGLTIVAVGTSLPELTASVMAAMRGKSDVALGNVVGSNIFNALGILGLTAVISPVAVDPAIAMRDNWVMLAAAAAALIFCFTKLKLSRLEGAVLLGGYIVYIGYLVRAA